LTKGQASAKQCDCILRFVVALVKPDIDFVAGH
jgi:hypothetical protein